MKKLIGMLTLALLSLCGSAQTNNTSQDSTPWDYIMMKNGKMIEVVHDKKHEITNNVILVNGTTIHPDGTINAGSGRTRRLKEGRYITMDGRIRKLKDMGGDPPMKR